MPSTPRNRATTVAAAVAVAAGALGLPLTPADAAPSRADTSTTHSRAAVRLAGHPLTVDRKLAHRAVPAVHLVRGGDTLTDLAKRYHTTVSAIRSANNLSDNQIVAGKRLTIPPAAGPSGAVDRTGSSPAVPRHPAKRTVTVRPGDTLSEIAASHKTTVAALRRANPKLHGNALHVGQRLNLPGAGHHRSTPAPHRHPGPKHSKHKVKRTFAGRTYSKEVTRAAQANKDALMNRAVPSRAAMQQMVLTTAKAHGLDPKLAQAIAHQESGFNMRAVSPANAVGVMQLIPSSVRWTSQLAGRTLDPLKPQDNVLAGVLLIKANLASTGGDVDKAIAGYYQGLGSIDHHGLYADTKQYVASVKAQMGRF